jgi:hypothetical protein
MYGTFRPWSVVVRAISGGNGGRAGLYGKNRPSRVLLKYSV